MLPTYRRLPSEMACGTWALGLLNANLEVYVFMLGDPGLWALGLSSDFTRQLGELKARPVVLTPFWKGDCVGAMDPISDLDQARMMMNRGPKALSYTLCSCGLGLSGPSDILSLVLY